MEVPANDEYNHHAALFFSGAKMTKVLDAMVADKSGERVFREWVTPTAIDIACETVSTQMDAMAKALSTARSITQFTPKFLRTWSLKENVVRPADTVASDVVKILRNTKKKMVGMSVPPSVRKY